ncbi:MAG: transposase [Acidobacteriia bacterium]|nr:transposase [Terriglobia bacterium]
MLFAIPGITSSPVVPLDRLWPGLLHQRCTVHKLRNLMAKAPKHVHEAVREGYHRIVYVETLDAAGKAREAFLWKWKKQCPVVAASQEKSGENLLTFCRFPESQWASLRTTNAIERMQLEFRRRMQPRPRCPTRGRATSVFRTVGQWPDEDAENQRLSRRQRQRKSCCSKKVFHDFTRKMRYSLFNRIWDTPTSAGNRTSRGASLAPRRFRSGCLH